MIVREAQMIDMPRLIELLAELREQSHYWGEGDRARTEGTVTALIQQPQSTVLVLEHEGALVGVMLCLLTPIWWQYGDAATDLATYVQPAHRGHGLKLIRAFEKWAKEFASVRTLYLSVSVGGEQGERSERLMTRLGYMRQGALLARRIEP